MMICLPPLIGMARVSTNVSPSQNWLWPWFDVDHLPRLIQWRVGWLRLRPKLWVRLLLYLLLPSSFIFKTLIIFPLNLFDLSAQLESLQLATKHAVGFVNARGADLVVHLHNSPNHVREVALHGVRHGAIMALASAQVHSGHELWFLPHSFPAAVHPGDHERLYFPFR